MRRFFNIPILIIMVLMLVSNSSMIFSDPQAFIYRIMTAMPAIIIGLSFHEFGHAITAYKLGDNTPKYQNRLTVSPLAHIDPIGMVFLVFAGFGWGVPVQIDPSNFKRPRRDELIVSLAGVTMNLIIAIVSAIIWIHILPFAFEFIEDSFWQEFLRDIMFNMVSINIVLLVFNLLPIPPLDGFGVITELFDLRKYSWYYAVYSNGFLILMLFIFLDLTDVILIPLVSSIFMMIVNLVTLF